MQKRHRFQTTMAGGANMIPHNIPEAVEVASDDVPGHPLSVRVFLVPNDPGFDALAVDLPGTVSYGDSEADALKNIEAAVRMTLEACKQVGIQNPWTTGCRPEGACLERRILVDA
jgi:predicted RNase H-like HicB family nuclease